VVRLHADSARRLVWLSVGEAPQQTIVRRSASDIDIAKLMSNFAGRDTLVTRSTSAPHDR
jgi:hypothetical protein